MSFRTGSDVSTLGKLIVSGPAAVEFLERLYPNRFGEMKIGRIRYAVLTSDVWGLPGDVRPVPVVRPRALATRPDLR